MHALSQVTLILIKGCFKRFSQSSNLTAHEKTHVTTITPMNKSFPQIQQNTVNPIFTVNPLKLMSNNKFSGSLNYQNLVNLNYLYSILRNSYASDPNHANPMMGNSSGLIFNVNNTNIPASKPFILSKQKFFKGQKIFNISKETNPYNRRKSVKIIYNNDEDDDSNERDPINSEQIENYEIKNEIEEEQYENGENMVKQGEDYEDETFDWIHHNFLNK